MLAEQVAALEKRADALEAKVDSGASASPSNDAQTLKRLGEIKRAILADRNDAERVVAERDSLKDENEALKGQVDKLNYRIMHLMRTIEQLEGAKK